MSKTPEFDGKSCPYCAGTSGYQYTFADKLTTFIDWGGQIQATEGDKPVFTRKMRCSDCNHIVEKYVENIRLTDRRVFR